MNLLFTLILHGSLSGLTVDAITHHPQFQAAAGQTDPMLWVTAFNSATVCPDPYTADPAAVTWANFLPNLMATADPTVDSTGTLSWFVTLHLFPCSVSFPT